jgi:hypothetical protein
MCQIINIFWWVLAWGAHQSNSQISGLGTNLISHIFYLAFHSYFCNMVNVFNVWPMWANLHSDGN